MMQDSTSSATFERYDDEFRSLMQQIEDSLDQDDSTIGVMLLQQCDDLIKQMSLEARSMPSTIKSKMMNQVKAYKDQYQQVQTRMEKQSLMAGTAANEPDGLFRQTEDTVSRQNETLERARRVMQETETVALEITEELGHNREVLLSAHGRVREVSGLTGRARRILSSMNQRAVQQKLVLYGVGSGLVLSFFVLMWFMWR